MTIMQIDNSLLKIFDLSCGKKKRLGAIGFDYSNRNNVGVMHVLNSFPYSFVSDSIV